jgi:sirohydrochlorin cobaltochelatase
MASSGKKSALILFAHGARERAWAEPFRAVRERVAASRPDLCVELAFLELMSPGLGDCVDALAESGHERITVAPLFLAMGGHLKQDLPRLLQKIRSRHGSLEISLLPPIGETPALLDAIASWLVNAAPR